MNNKPKIVVVIFLIILVIVICICCFTKKESTDGDGTVQNNFLENTSLENEVNIVSNETNEINTNSANNNEIIENVVHVPEQGAIYENDSNIGTTDKKQEAIDLVKIKWGEDDTVTFRCDSITANGEYIIAVVSSETASVKNYFIVNLEKQTVTIDY